MALMKREIEDWTLDDLLEAINPAPPSTGERFRRALAVAVNGWQEGQLTDEQASEFIKALFTVKLNGEVSEMISDYFTPKSRRRSEDASRGGFSLIL